MIQDKNITKIILIQARPASRLESRENLDRALNLLEGCQGQEADLICFLEYFLFSGEQELAAAARGPRAYLVAGLVEHEGRQAYNTATLFDRSGRLLGRQRKHYLGNLERRGFGVQPGENWPLWDKDFGRLGSAVCIDFWGQPEAARQLAAQRVDLIVNPGIFPILRGPWHMATLTRAFDYYIPVVGINAAGVAVEIADGGILSREGIHLPFSPRCRRIRSELARQVRDWDDLEGWIVARAGDTEAVFSVNLDIDGPRHWRPAIRLRFGFQNGGQQISYDSRFKLQERMFKELLIWNRSVLRRWNRATG